MSVYSNARGKEEEKLVSFDIFQYLSSDVVYRIRPFDDFQVRWIKDLRELLANGMKKYLMHFLFILGNYVHI